MRCISFTLVSLLDFSKQSVAEKVISTLMNAQGILRPTAYGAFEPASVPIQSDSVKQMINVWLGSHHHVRAGTLVLKTEDIVEYLIAWQEASDNSHFPFIGGSVQTRVLDGNGSLLEEYLRLVASMASDVATVYGEVRNTRFAGWDLPFDLDRRLPAIPWASIYGRLYIDHFGLERIKSAPFARIVELPDGMVWAEATPSVFEEVSDQRKAAIRRHLGEDSFMSQGRWRYSNGSAPKLRS